MRRPFPTGFVPTGFVYQAGQVRAAPPPPAAEPPRPPTPAPLHDFVAAMERGTPVTEASVRALRHTARYFRPLVQEPMPQSGVTVTVTATVRLGWRDRLRLGLGGRIRFRLLLDCARDPGTLRTRQADGWPLARGEP